MSPIRVVSFDMEGTIVDPTFSHLVWENDIPKLYADKHGISLKEAKQRVFREYQEIGDERIEWYDVAYWFSRLGLPGDWRELLEKRRGACRLYSEARGVLDRLRHRYTLIVTSNTIREFLEVQICDLAPFFARIFSAPSDFGDVKKSAEFYGRICGEMGVEPGAMAHVGDHFKFDYEAPRKLGINAYYLDRSLKLNGDHIVHDLGEFEEKIAEL